MAMAVRGASIAGPTMGRHRATAAGSTVEDLDEVTDGLCSRDVEFEEVDFGSAARPSKG
ncbi:MAG: hypothetical protein ACLFWM_11215 [Actinomycetota bacterium]